MLVCCRTPCSGGSLLSHVVMQGLPLSSRWRLDCRPCMSTAIDRLLQPISTLPAHISPATSLAACHCSHDRRLSCGLHLELALSLPCRRTQEAMNLWQVLGQKAATPSTVLPPGIPAEQQEALRRSMCLKAAEAATELRALSMRQASQHQGLGQQVGVSSAVGGQRWLSPEQLPAGCYVRVQRPDVLAVWTACLASKHQLRLK